MKKMIQEYPSKEFGLHIDMPELYKEWLLPDNIHPDDFGHLLLVNRDEGNFSYIKESYLRIIKDNPELKDVNITMTSSQHYHVENEILRFALKRREEYKSMFDICFGALSKFCFDDIKSYTELGRDNVKRNISLRGVYRDISIKTGKHAYWVLSDFSLEKVCKKFDIIHK